MSLALLGASCAQVHSELDDAPTSVDKVPPQLQRDLLEGVARDVLVELAPEPEDAASADAGLGTSMQPSSVDPGSPAITRPLSDAEVEARAASYRRLQDGILSAVDPSEVELRVQYENLPYLFVHVTSLHGLQALAGHEDVLRLHEERVLEHQLAESLPMIRQPVAAAAGKTGAGTSVAVLDTGCDFTRTDFGSCQSAGAPGCKVAYAADLAPSDNARDDNGHGTNVSAIVLGVAPSTKVLALDVFSGGSASGAVILSAIDWSIANRNTYNIVAMNLSLGSGMFTAACPNDYFAAALTNARSAGIVPVVASGNNGYQGALSSPACVPAAVSVGAVYDAPVGGLSYGACSDQTTAADKITCFSNSAPFLSMLAPGAPITAGGITMTGTSQAAPHVAGALAVVRAAFPSEPLQTNVARITDTGPNITDPRNQVTKHRLDLSAALGTATSDSVGPTGSVTINAAAAATNSTRVTLTIAGSDPSGVASMCISNTSTCTSFEAFATSKAWTLATGDGAKTVRVVLRDGVGNLSIFTATIKLDTSVPVGGTLTAAATNGQVALRWTTASDTGAGVVGYRLVVAPNTAPSCATGSLVYFGSALSYVHTGLANGTVYAYRLCPVDGAGNLGVGSTALARPVPELTPPTGSFLINNGAALTRSTSVTLTLSATDASGLGGMCISNTTTCAKWEAYASNKTWTVGTSNGAARVYVWFKDRYENAMTAPVSASITVDSTAPTGASLTATAGTKSVSLSWTAASDLNGVDSYKLVYAQGGNAPASCNAGLALYAGTALSFTHGGLNSNTLYSYRLCAIDKVGNVSAGSTKTVTAR